MVKEWVVFVLQKSVELGTDLPGLKLQTIHVGGLPGENNPVTRGFVGCIQVCVCFILSSHLHQTTVANTDVLIFRVCVWEKLRPVCPTWTWRRAWRSVWRRAVTCPTHVTLTSAPRTATAATNGPHTPASVTQVHTLLHTFLIGVWWRCFIYFCLLLQVTLGKSVWTLVNSTRVNMCPPAFANPAPLTATPVNVDRTIMDSTAKMCMLITINVKNELKLQLIHSNDIMQKSPCCQVTVRLTGPK